MPLEETDKYSNELILVVDDDEMVRDLVAEMLSHLGFAVNSVGSGRDALTELEKEDGYTFMLTDISMPGMDGLELIKKVKEDYTYVCSIAMTGHSKEYKYIDVVNAGATDFINKPLGMEELEAKIKRGILERNIKKELSRLSITDSLTGLYNQRYFYARLEDEVLRAKRQHNQLGLIFLDLDDFKNYNDTHGHLAGDELLRKVGKIVKVRIRQGVDSGYRYGGDEFAIILIDADRSVLQRIEKRIKKAIKEECGLGASVGHAYFSKGMTLKKFVDRADQRLYEEKKSKNNLLHVKSPD